MSAWTLQSISRSMAQPFEAPAHSLNTKMSHHSCLCGFIRLKGDRAAALDEIWKLPERCEQDAWPFLTSAMFSHTDAPQYGDEIVHFAASYKDILGAWPEWSAKFESLLTRLSFTQAKVLVEDEFFGDFIARWQVRQTPRGEVRTKSFRELNAYKNDQDCTLFGDFGSNW